MKTSCSFRFGLLDVAARRDARFSATQNQPFARLEDVNDEDAALWPKILTLEPDFGWPLDGSQELLPTMREDAYLGWWVPVFSQEDGSFLQEPVLTVRLLDAQGASTQHSSTGLTLTFAKTPPAWLQVLWYDMEDRLLFDETFRPDALVYFCERQVEEYSRIEIRVQAMPAGNRYLHMTRLQFGSLEVLDESRVCQATIQEEIDPSLLTLPVSTLEISLFTPGGRFSLLDPKGVYKLLQWKQEIEAQKTIDGIDFPLGSYYLQEAEGTVGAVTKLSCVDAIGILDAIEYDGNLYYSKPLRELLDEILTPEYFDFELALEFEEVTLTGYLPICTKREALWQIAFAIGALIYPNRSRTFQVRPLPKVLSVGVDPQRKLLGHTVTMESPVTQVEVLSHHYAITTYAESARELHRVTLPPGDHKVTFGRPVSVTNISGGILLNRHPNYRMVRVSEEAEVILYGYEYADVTAVHTVTNDHLPAGVKAGTVRVTDATLLDATKAQAAAQRLYDFYQNRYTDEGGVLPGTECVGEMLAMRNTGERTLTGYVQRLSTDLYGGCVQTILLRGK